MANTPEQIQQMMVTRLIQALATNKTYLALASPTTAQNTAQIKALTKHVDALTRLALGMFADDLTDV